MSGGKSSRTKGVNGERESADIFRRYGFEVVRLQNNVLDAGDFTAMLYGQQRIGRDSAPALSLLVDAKRRERLNLSVASAQVESVARNGFVPAVVYRRNREPWRISQRLADYCRTLEDFARLLGDVP